MSGQQIGTVVGGIIGAYFGAPQLGAAIGGMIGGAVDPTKVYGPRLTDAQNQTAMDGVFRAYGDGTFPCKGNLIWYDITKEHKHTDDGKGSGQEQITYTYTRSYAIGVCKGPISGYKIIKRNGKVVFDARTDAELAALGYTGEQIAESRAAQAKFRKVCTLYYGTTDQMPDPTMVAVEGVGNVPAYAGTAYIVLTDDETMQGEVAQYEFVVANCGDRTEDYSDSGNARILITGTAPEDGSPMWAMASANASPDFYGIPQSSGANFQGGVPGFGGGRFLVAGADEARSAQSPFDEWDSLEIDTLESQMGSVAGGDGGWLAREVYTEARPLLVAATGTSDFVRVSPPVTLTNSIIDFSIIEYTQRVFYTGGYYYATSGYRLFRSSVAGEPYTAVWDDASTVAAGWDPNGACIISFLDGVSSGESLYCTTRWHFNDEFSSYQIRWSPDQGRSWPEENILYDAPWASEKPFPVQLERMHDGTLVAYCYGGGVLTSANGFSGWIDTGLAGPANPPTPEYMASGRRIGSVGANLYVLGYGVDGDKIVVSQDGGLTFSDPILLPISSAEGMAVGIDSQLQPIPDSPGYYINRMTGEIVGPDGTQISVCEPTLGEVVSRQCAKRISTDMIDVSDLTDPVTGFRVASPSSPQKNIGALMPGYFFDGSEFDGVLHFPKRGGEDSFALTVDDLCERDGDLIQWERTQEPELLRKITVSYLDPDTTYTVTTQQWERRSGTVKAEGEGSIELPVVGSKDWAARAVHKAGKVAWAESDKCTFHTSIAKAELVTAAVGTIVDEAGTIHRVRIERIEDEGLVRMIHARRTRADVYVSTVTGASKPLPLFPGSDIRGPTDGLLLNLPVIVDSNDVPGIAWAAGGSLSGWRGGTLQFLRAGVWTDAGTVTLPATMGTLLAPLPAHAGDIDYVNTLSVRMNDALESVTFTNLLQERNPLAIVYPDGTAEIVQFQTATEVAAGEYELTTLIRGRLNTVRGDHAEGARVVFLDNSVQYAGLQPTDVGTTLTYRFVSLGTDPDAAVTQTIDLTTMQSQTEWPVDSLEVEKDGDDFTLTWLARDRLGTDVFPIRSTNWRGYQVSWTHGDQTGAQIVLTETATFNLPGASDVTFSVSQLNLYTGAGPAQTVTIP